MIPESIQHDPKLIAIKTEVLEKINKAYNEIISKQRLSSLEACTLSTAISIELAAGLLVHILDNFPELRESITTDEFANGWFVEVKNIFMDIVDRGLH